MPVKHSSTPFRLSAAGITALVAAVALIFCLTLTFLHSHDYLHRAVVVHDKQLAFKSHAIHLGPNDWHAIYKYALLSKDSNEFIQQLRAEGLVEGSRVNQQTPPGASSSSSSMDATASATATEMEAILSDLDADAQKLSGTQKGPPERPAKTGGPLEEDYDDELEGVASGKGNMKPVNPEDSGQPSRLQAAASQPTKPATATMLAPNFKWEQASADTHASASTLTKEEEWLTLPVNGGPPPMSAALARKQAVNNTVIVTWANYALYDFVKNWVHHVRQLGITNFLVGAMDQQIGEALVQAGVPSFAMYEQHQNHSGVGTNNLDWGGQSFHKMGRQKIALAKLFLGVKTNLLLVDVDVVILRNVLEYFNRHAEADILVSTDLLASSLEPGDDGLELPHAAGAPMNIGIMYFKYNENTTRFVNHWLDVILADDKYWDQNAFNDLARAGWDPIHKLHPNNKRVFIGYNGSLAVGVLPTASFSGGHSFYIQKMYEVQKVQPYAVHCTFQYGANAGKRNRMREAMIFEDEESYYTGDDYIMFDLEQVPDMPPLAFAKLNYTDKKTYHKKWLLLQLQSVWPALGLSLMFQRAVIMPKLACYCDRFWAPLEDCRVPGASKERLPFLCPQDYVLDPMFLTDDASPMKIRWREHSFLENPRCPESVKRSKLTIFLSPNYPALQEKYIVQEGGLVVLVPSGLNTTDLFKLLVPYRTYKIWHFKGISQAFSEFEDPGWAADFKKRLNHLQPITQPDNM